MADSASVRLTPTALGLVACPPWCADDHADIGLTDCCIFHQSVPLGFGPASDGEVVVAMRKVTGLDGADIEDDDEPGVWIGWDMHDNHDADMTPAAARQLAAALLDAADAADIATSTTPA